MLVELSGAVFGYGQRAVVRAGRIVLDEGRCLGVYGPNGSGKTTLVRGLLGLIAPLAGQVTRRSGLRLGYMPQNRSLQLHWPMSGMDAAALAVSAGKPLGRIGQARARLRERMALLGVGELAERSFARLSGGQQQRLLLAGVIAAEPDLLVLDEPTDGLDARSSALLLQHIRGPSRSTSTVLISHDVDELLHAADEVAWVHPADEPEAPADVEVIAPRELVARVSGLRAATGATGAAGAAGA